jgi:hypothetical protein
LNAVERSSTIAYKQRQRQLQQQQQRARQRALFKALMSGEVGALRLS